MLNVTVALTVLVAARSESRAQAAAAAEAVTDRGAKRVVLGTFSQL
jgi:hypothetical protein